MIGTALSPAPVTARAADWRFVLPAAPGGLFEHLVIPGGSPQLVSDVAALGVARRVSASLPHGERADAIAVLAGVTAPPVETVAAHLAPGGVLYWEVDRRTPGQHALTPARLRGHMSRYGVDVAAAYWVKPGFPHRDMYLPLASGAAFEWYLETLYRCPTRRRKVVKQCVRAVVKRTGGIGAIAPCYAVTAVRGPSRLPAVLERARTEGICGGADIEHVLIANGQAEWSRLVFLLFERDRTAPTTAIKLPRTPEFNQEVRREHSTLQQLGHELTPALRGTIPVSTVFELDDLAVSAETCVRGRSLTTGPRADATQSINDLQLVTGWLTAFHRETTVATIPVADWIERDLLHGVCDDYAAALGLNADEDRLFAALRLPHDAPPSAALPLVWHHADFGPWNVYRDGTHISVIDWEVARRGPALTDLLYFVAHWAAAASGNRTAAERIRHFETLFCSRRPPGPLGRAVRPALLGYMQAVGVPPALFPHLLVYTVLEQAVDLARRLDRTDSGRAECRDDNEYVGCVRVLAAHVDTLFNARHVQHA